MLGLVSRTITLSLILTLMALLSVGKASETEKSERYARFYNHYYPQMVAIHRDYAQGEFNIDGALKFYSDVQTSWNKIYDNELLELTDRECRFWIGMQQLRPIRNDIEAGDVVDGAEFWWRFVSSESTLSESYRSQCMAPVVDAKNISMTQLIADPDKYIGNRVGILGIYYHDGLSGRLYFGDDQFAAQDLVNSILLSNTSEWSDYHGRSVWIEGRYSVNCASESVVGKRCLSQTRLIKLLDQQQDETKTTSIATSIIQLLTKPEDYRNKSVRVMGFIRNDRHLLAITLTRQPVGHFDIGSAVQISTDDWPHEHLNNQYVEIEGIFKLDECESIGDTNNGCLTQARLRKVIFFR